MNSGRESSQSPSEEMMDTDDLDYMLDQKRDEARWRFDDSIELPERVKYKSLKPDDQVFRDLEISSEVSPERWNEALESLTTGTPWEDSPFHEVPDPGASSRDHHASVDSYESESGSGVRSGGKAPVGVEADSLPHIDPEELEEFVRAPKWSRSDNHPLEWDEAPLEPMADVEDELPEDHDWSRSHRLTREEILEGLAAEIIRKSGWAPKGLRLLVGALRPYEAFHLPFRDLVSFLKSESPRLKEFARVLQLRSIWQENGYSAGYSYVRGIYGLQSISYKNNLDWWLALELSRSLENMSMDAIRLFIEDCFDDWRNKMSGFTEVEMTMADNDDAMYRSTKVFAEYLEHVATRYADMEGNGQRMPPEIDYRLFESDEDIPDRRKEHWSMEEILREITGESGFEGWE